MATNNRSKYGRFKPKNPQKYVGNKNQIFWRSTWELRVFKLLDINPSILRWSSEEFSVHYIHPFLTDATGRPKICRYFPDLYIVYRNLNGNIQKEIIEIKPMKETIQRPGMSEHDKMAYAVNQAKWQAADRFAEAQGAKFRVLTEQSLFYSPRRKR